MMYSSQLYLSFMKKIENLDDLSKQGMSDTGSFITQRFHVFHLGIFDWYYEDQEFLAASGQNYVMTIMWFWFFVLFYHQEQLESANTRTDGPKIFSTIFY